eukprot:6946986-Pyramimonas_sp.AAC.1
MALAFTSANSVSSWDPTPATGSCVAKAKALVRMSSWRTRAPNRSFEDPKALLGWAGRAHALADAAKTPRSQMEAMAPGHPINAPTTPLGNISDKALPWPRGPDPDLSDSQITWGGSSRRQANARMDSSGR